MLRLSTPSKLQCYALGFTPGATCPVQGSICQTCYAKNGFCKMFGAGTLAHNTALIQGANYKQARRLLLDALERAPGTYFRFNYSGDFSTQTIADAYLDACSKYSGKGKIIWIVTKTDYIAPGHYLFPHCTVAARRSERDINVFSGAPYTAAVNYNQKAPEEYYQCPGDCSKCRVCYGKNPMPVAYAWHGDAVVARKAREIYV